MNRVLLFITTVLLYAVTAMAQTDSVKMAFDRIVNLETKLGQQNNIISNLRSEVQSVTRQNLALKNSLNLQPTMAESVYRNGIVVKLMQLDADSINNSVTLTMLITATADGSTNFFKVEKARFIDENGDEYMPGTLSDIANGNVGVNTLFDTTQLYTDTPIKGKIILKDMPNHPQFFKRIVLSSFWGDYSFQNIPINWK